MFSGRWGASPARGRRRSGRAIDRMMEEEEEEEE